MSTARENPVPPPQSLSEFQTLRLQQLWSKLSDRPRQAILATLVRIVACQASPLCKEVTHEDA
jgi:hypothetical protein